MNFILHLKGKSLKDKCEKINHFFACFDNLGKKGSSQILKVIISGRADRAGS